ncbi:hypothetical protein [Yoonia sp. 2307UL14-13]|uniref:hypothetical protein n=1 Tax=Yoonia sp. 2307UL14-13 TaxID=3126506 RepID=UPI0030A39CF6
MKNVILLACVTSIGLTAAPAMAEPKRNLDRVEDRIDRIESRRDERVDRGPLDRIEDRIDRRESVLDRAGVEYTPRIDRHERRSWFRRWH